VTYLELTCRALLGAVFLVSGLTKVAGRGRFPAFARSARRLGSLPRAWTLPVARAVVAAELAVVCLLASPVTAVADFGFVLAGGLLVVFAAAIARSLRRGEREPCRCFGPSNAPLGWRHVLRNAVLAGVALLGLLTRGQAAVLESFFEEKHMAVVYFVVGFVGVLTLLNLTMMTGVIRRLGEHEQALSGYAGLTGGWPATPLLDVGERIGPFETLTVDGEPVSRENLADGTLVGFFDPGCDTCHEQLPEFVARAGELAEGRTQTLAVVGDGDDTDDLVGQLRPYVRVAVEPRRGPLQQAFGVRLYPAFCCLGADQVVVRHGLETAHAAAVSG
jgi:uncharacterized membrane protein YphA (DoxX/SURF4 family)